MEDYQKQANDFAKKYGVSITFQHEGCYARLDEVAVAQWRMTLTRGGRVYEFDYSSSIYKSWLYSNDVNSLKSFKGLPPKSPTRSWPGSGKAFYWAQYKVYPNPHPKPPTMYDILACVQKYDVGTFEEFCAEFGYEDRPLSEYPEVVKIYEAVQREFQGVSRLFPEPEVLEELQDIS